MSSANSIAAPTGKPRAYTRMHWWITALLFFSTVINYMDRQTLSLTIVPISSPPSAGRTSP